MIHDYSHDATHTATLIYYLYEPGKRTEITNLSCPIRQHKSHKGIMLNVRTDECLNSFDRSENIRKFERPLDIMLKHE